MSPGNVLQNFFQQEFPGVTLLPGKAIDENWSAQCVAAGFVTQQEARDMAAGYLSDLSNVAVVISNNLPENWEYADTPIPHPIIEQGLIVEVISKNVLGAVEVRYDVDDLNKNMDSVWPDQLSWYAL
ncbi:MAG: hypothetical protein ACR2IE_09975 [Candidatus Sumerlaeaceae bacterium]